MHRFLSHVSLREKFVLTEGGYFYQIMNVFRSKKGDTMIFFEEEGDDIMYEIEEITKKKIVFLKKELVKKNRVQKDKKTSLFQAYPNKISTMELIVQKWVEIGLDEIIFFTAKYSQISSIPEKKKTRLTSISQEALEQSGGNKLTNIIFSEDKLEVLLKKYPHMHHIISFPHASMSLPLKNIIYPVSLWVWPEGGWSPEEKSYFTENNLPLWSFNDRILRLETASIVGVGILRYLFSQ